MVRLLSIGRLVRWARTMGHACSVLHVASGLLLQYVDRVGRPLMDIEYSLVRAKDGIGIAVGRHWDWAVDIRGPRYAPRDDGPAIEYFSVVAVDPKACQTMQRRDYNGGDVVCV